MAENKRSFLLYVDLIHTVKKMKKEKAGELFLTILEYVNDLNPDVEDELIDLVFEPIKQQLKRDLLKYKEICIKNKENIGKRWNKEDTTEYDRIQPDTIYTDSDIDTDTDTENEIYKNFDFFKDGFKTIWIKEFLPLKKKKEASVSDRAIKSQLNKIKKLSNNNYLTAFKILEKSVNSGWTDFYEIKEDESKHLIIESKNGL